MKEKFFIEKLERKRGGKIERIFCGNAIIEYILRDVILEIPIK